MPNSSLPGNTYLGDGQRTTVEMQNALDQVATWLNAAQAELNALTGTTLREGAVRSVGTGTDQIPDKEILDTRLGTTGNLGDAALRDVGTGTAQLVEGARIVKVASGTGAGIASGGSNAISIPAADIQLYAITFGVLCTSDTSIPVTYGDRNPPSGEAGAYIQGSFGNRRLVIKNNTAITQEFDYAVYRIEMST